jgi:hypothetical protein
MHLVSNGWLIKDKYTMYKPQFAARGANSGWQHYLKGLPYML